MDDILQEALQDAGIVSPPTTRTVYIHRPQPTAHRTIPPTFHTSQRSQPTVLKTAIVARKRQFVRSGKDVVASHYVPTNTVPMRNGVQRIRLVSSQPVVMRPRPGVDQVRVNQPIKMIPPTTAKPNEQNHEDIDEDEKIIQVDTFTDYQPLKLRSGTKHPDPVVETASLSSVSAPEIRYHMTIPEELIDSGKISALQLEAALYASQAHETKLPSGERVGYLIGDGAGVGKGRTIAAIIYENYLLGRKRAIWVSVSADLFYDAKRDLNDIGADKIDVYQLNSLKYAPINSPENGSIRRGVIFTTYSSLICEPRQKETTDGEAKTNNHRLSSRLAQLVQWCGEDFDGLIIFDECHHAKNLVPTAGSKPTKTGRYVLEIQKQLPNARVVYASATGASEPRNMAYMTRLGLWGAGQTFATFNDFIHAVEDRGVGAMELVAMDMKLRGLYLARQLSFKGVDFSVQEVLLTDEFIRIYDESVKLWMECHRQFKYAIEHSKSDDRYQRNAWAQFWSAHQRFFKYLCIGAKVHACVAIAKQALQDGKCVVIGLQSTGEAQTLGVLGDAGEITDFVSTTKAVLQTLIERHFPTGDSESMDVLGDIGRMFSVGSGNSSGTYTQRRRRSQLSHQPIDSLIRKHSPTNGRNRNNQSSEDEDSEEDEEPPKRRRLSLNNDVESNHSSDEDDLDGEDDLSDVDSTTDDGDDSFSKQATVPPASTIEPTNSLFETLMGELDESFSAEINPFHHDFSSAEDPWAHLQHYQEDLAEAQRKREREAQEARERAKLERQKQRRRARRRRERREKRRREREAFENRERELQERMKRRFENGAGTADAFMESTRVIDNSVATRDAVSLMMIKTELLAAVERLGQMLPPNTLDQLIDELGGPRCVAEMTGRRGRIVIMPNGQAEYQLRNADSLAPVDLMNLEEKEKFMSGEKLVAVISEAASSGISLQSDKRVENKRRRVHITLELPWSADKAVQQFGRTHRSNQVSAPEYLFLISELAGEKRFASVVAKRLECLGALTHGDRRAAESRDLSQFNLDNKYGREALHLMIRALADPKVVPILPAPSNYPVGSENFFSDMRQYLVGVGVLGVNEDDSQSYVVEKEGSSLSKFLNRLLGLPVHAQNALFSYFTDIINELVRRAKKGGIFDKGIMDLGGESDQAKKIEHRVFRGNCNNANFVVEMHKIGAERGVKWEQAKEQYEAQDDPVCGFYMSKPHVDRQRTIILVVSNGKNVIRHLCIIRPNTGRSPKYESQEDIERRFVRITVTEAEPIWIKQYQDFGKMCLHRFLFNDCKREKNVFCELGRRFRTYFVLTGSVIAVWPLLEKALTENRTKGQHNSHMQIVRIRTDDNQKLVGLLVMPQHVRIMLTALTKMSSTSERAA
ncbi:hypothetical protein M3Y94_00125800 [Aphelenchoides besseyi]|nr:hypothetical protein M3Y94_00125800 [Aphelenchoides besseyi]KAI6237390.1 hypothetical protein M3Y95_00259900 [Aphelenchoides besseyi]